jgi:tRNA-specific 2-thiouridylase
MTEKPSSKTVLIAMTGGIESTVAAYLLKKQGYRCIGIGLQLFEAGDERGPFADIAVADLGKVKSICDYLDIPFYAVNASEIFADKVLDPMVGRILSGQTFEPMVYLNNVLIEILMEKTKKFQTTMVATAHYAKVLKNQKTGSYELIVANDVEHDQSYMLAGLTQKHLENLILPLSEIRKKEVQKISELIKVDFIPRPKVKADHIMHDPRMIALVEDRAPKDLLKPGTIYDYANDTSIFEHTGIHRFYVGQKNLAPKGEIKIDENKQVISIVPFKGNIFIDYPSRLKFQHIQVVKFTPAAHLDMSTPLVAFVKLSSKADKLPCRLYLKNNNMILVEFDEVHSGLLVSGQFLVFYNRQHEKGKVLGAGLVDLAGIFDEYGYNTLPDNKKDTSDEDKESPKAKDKMRF